MARIYSMVQQAESGLLEAARALRQGGVVIFPTETFYGMAVLPRDKQAVDKLVALKSRLPHKPIPLIAHNQAACAAMAALPPIVEPLCAAFWPGPLTLVLEPHDAAAWPRAIVGDALSVGVRVSSHPIAAALAAAGGGIITATSANFASVAAVASCAALDPVLVDQVDVVLDGGTLPGGLASTVVRVDEDGTVAVLRAGAIGVDAIKRLVQP